MARAVSCCDAVWTLREDSRKNLKIPLRCLNYCDLPHKHGKTNSRRHNFVSQKRLFCCFMMMWNVHNNRVRFKSHQNIPHHYEEEQFCLFWFWTMQKCSVIGSWWQQREAHSYKNIQIRRRHLRYLLTAAALLPMTSHSGQTWIDIVKCVCMLWVRICSTNNLGTGTRAQNVHHHVVALLHEETIQHPTRFAFIWIKFNVLSKHDLKQCSQAPWLKCQQSYLLFLPSKKLVL